MKVTNELTIYELQEGEGKTFEHHQIDDKVVIKNHGIYDDRLIIEFRGVNITLIKNDLINAITNACNHRKL